MPSLRVHEAAEFSQDLAGAACWSCKRELYTASDDGTLRRWGIKGEHLQQASVGHVEGKDKAGFSITALHAPAQETTSALAAACSDGRLRLISYSGRLEKVTDAAHDGSVVCVRWNRNGTAVATGGEDGALKTWSSTGMIRATVAQGDKPIYSLAWSPDNASIAYTCGSYVCVEASECATSKPSQWQALEVTTAQAGGVLLSIDWSSLHGYIVTGGEDCRYAVWDQNGILMFRSERLDSPPISVAWRPQGDTFLVGLHNHVLLCDAAGWLAAHARHTAGGAQAVAWAPGGMRCGVATGSGKIIFGSVLDLEEQNGTSQVCLKDTGTLDVSDVATGTIESLEFSEPVEAFALGHGRLLVATGSQVRVYKVGSGVGSMTPCATAAIHELLVDIKIAERCFMLLLATSGPQVYDYQGKLLCAPKPQSMPLDSLTPRTVALSPDTLAFLHPTTRTSVHFCNIPGGAETSDPLRIRREDDSRRLVSDGSVAVMDIVEVALSQSGTQAERLLVFSDANSDLYVAAAMAPAPIKLAASVSSFRWNDACDILAATSDGHLLLWYCPQAALAAHDLLDLTRERRAVSWGPAPSIEAFGGSLLTARQREGTRKAGSASAGAVLLHKLLQVGRWGAGLQLCRARNEKLLWAILAALAVKAGQLEAATAAFASIDQVDKVSYLQSMDTIPNHHIRRAELLLLQGKHSAAEEVLVSNRLIWAAVDLNVRLFNWDRALGIAEQSNDPMHVQGVLWLRAHYLSLLNKDPLKGGKQDECLDKFARLFQEQGVPTEKPVKSFIHEQSLNEGLIVADQQLGYDTGKQKRRRRRKSAEAPASIRIAQPEHLPPQQRKKAANLAWTSTYRRAHKKDLTGEQAKRKRRNLNSKKPRAVAGVSLEEIQKKRNERPDVRAKAREMNLAEVKARMKKARATRHKMATAAKQGGK